MFDQSFRRAAEYVDRMRLGDGWQFRMSGVGQQTVYASCFAAMIWRYTGVQESRIAPGQKSAWAGWINGFQDPNSGYFLVPEIEMGQNAGEDHDREHLRQHFCAHALPALASLGDRPRYPLLFVRPFLQPEHMQKWLASRDWSKAWLEGNNLLFIGQFLLHTKEFDGVAEASSSLDQLMDWLDKELDPRTGLWGTQHGSSVHDALYGGYHQLLLYYYLKRPFPYPKPLIDSVLSMQHFDGGFHRYRGGGTCQDVDAIDVLVNFYKRCDYRRQEVRRALWRAADEVLSRQMADGGFCDRPDHDFLHNGMEATRTPPGVGNMFSTWFGVHTLRLVEQVLGSPASRHTPAMIQYFNPTLSMGWHDPMISADCSEGQFERSISQASSKAKRLITDAYVLVSRLRQKT